MDSKVISAIKEQIEAQRTELQSTAAKLQAELAGVEQQISRLSAAFAALSGDEKSATLKPEMVRKKNGKPAASKADVIKHVRSILEQEGVVEEEGLKRLVEERITEAGFTRMGLSLRLKEALGDSQFVDTPAGVRLKEEKMSVSHSSGVNASTTIGTSSSSTSQGVTSSRSESTREPA